MVPIVAGTPRLLIVVKTLDIGGAERLVVDAVGRWPKSVEVAYLAGDGGLAQELRQMHCQVHDLSTRRRIGFGTVRGLHRLLRSGRFDLVHAHLPVAGTLVRLLAGDLPIVYTEHNVWEAYRVPSRWMNRLTFARNSEVITVSADVLASVRRGWPSDVPPITTVTNGIASYEPRPQVRSEVRSREGVVGDALVLLNVANLFPRKGHDVLLAALALRTVKTPFVMWIAGEGPSRHALEAIVAAHGLTSQVRFLGQRHDVRDLMAASDVFVMPSRFEGLPVAMLEAMDSGLPVVATRVGGIPEVLQKGAGLLVPPEAPAQLAEALATLAADPAQRATLARAGRARVRDHFSAARMDAMTATVYQRALSSANPRRS